MIPNRRQKFRVRFFPDGGTRNKLAEVYGPLAEGHEERPARGATGDSVWNIYETQREIPGNTALSPLVEPSATIAMADPAEELEDFPDSTS